MLDRKGRCRPAIQACSHLFIISRLFNRVFNNVYNRKAPGVVLGRKEDGGVVQRWESIDGERGCRNKVMHIETRSL